MKSNVIGEIPRIAGVETPPAATQAGAPLLSEGFEKSIRV